VGVGGGGRGALGGCTGNGTYQEAGNGLSSAAQAEWVQLKVSLRRRDGGGVSGGHRCSTFYSVCRVDHNLVNANNDPLRISI
jgi:hypothetical protein